MKKILLIVTVVCFYSNISAQYVYQIKADSVRIHNDSCKAELILENSTKNVNGFLYNKGNGRTEFRSAVIKLNDSMYKIGGDTLKVTASVNAILNQTAFYQSGSYKISGTGSLSALTIRNITSTHTPLQFTTIQGDTVTGTRPYSNFYHTIDQAYTNADGQQDAVYMWGYNQDGVGGRKNTNEAAFHTTLESHYITGGAPNFEYHLQSEATGGQVYRHFSMMVNKNNGTSTSFWRLNNMQWFANSGTNNPYMTIGNSGIFNIQGYQVRLSLNDSAGNAAYTVTPDLTTGMVQVFNNGRGLTRWINKAVYNWEWQDSVGTVFYVQRSAGAQFHTNKTVVYASSGQGVQHLMYSDGQTSDYSLFMYGNGGANGSNYGTIGNAYAQINFDTRSGIAPYRFLVWNGSSWNNAQDIFSDGTVGINTNNSETSITAQLQITSTTKGFLPPRMTKAQKDAISSPSVGLQLYVTNSNEGYYANLSSGWKRFLTTDDSSALVSSTSGFITASSTNTLTNKRITPRVQSVSSSSTVTPLADSSDAVRITALATNLTLANPSGTPVSEQKMNLYILDNGTSRTITYGSQYRPIGVTLPTATTASLRIRMQMIWNATDSKWDVVSVVKEANQFMSISSTGATVTTDGNFKVYTFTGSGTFTINSLGADPNYGSNIEALVVAGGGGGGGAKGGGGGGGGIQYNSSLAVTAQSYTVTVGAGGTGGIVWWDGTNGSNSVFSTLSATGGGAGAADPQAGSSSNSGHGYNGGSGGGGGRNLAGNGAGGTGSQGGNGGTGSNGTNNWYAGGGGGGSSSSGSNAGTSGGGGGGNGSSYSISGTATIYAGGGGGGALYGMSSGGSGGYGSGGTGGGGNGGAGNYSGDYANATNGTNGLGGGGGGGANAGSGGNGGSGIVIIRVKFQ